MKTLYVVCVATLSLSCARETPAPPPPPATATQATQTVPEPQADPKCVAAPRVLCPSDEGDTDPTFAAFRRDLLAAVAQRDETRLLTFVDPAIRTSFGDGGGLPEFTRSLDEARWSDLEQILSHGGAFREGMFWAPYVYAAWPESIDAFQHVAALRSGVPIRVGPSDSTNEVAKVDYAILELLPKPNDTPNWLHVRTADGKEGWVSSSDVRSPIAARAGFSKSGGAWKMNTLVAGD